MLRGKKKKPFSTTDSVVKSFERLTTFDLLWAVKLLFKTKIDQNRDVVGNCRKKILLKIFSKSMKLEEINFEQLTNTRANLQLAAGS